MITVTWAISYPIAKLLDCCIGHGTTALYRRAQLKVFFSFLFEGRLTEPAPSTLCATCRCDGVVLGEGAGQWWCGGAVLGEGAVQWRCEGVVLGRAATREEHANPFSHCIPGVPPPPATTAKRPWSA